MRLLTAESLTLSPQQAVALEAAGAEIAVLFNNSIKLFVWVPELLSRPLIGFSLYGSGVIWER